MLGNAYIKNGRLHREVVMNKPFPDNVFLRGIWEPLRTEYDINEPIVIGKIPTELNGTFYRNGPNPQYVYSKNYHMFEGDGMLHAVTFENGKVRYQNRWIRTEKFLLEQKAGRSLFGGMRDGLARDESVVNRSHNTANTNIIWHHDNLLALNEGGQPVRINQHDLTQCNNYTFNNFLHQSMMAHPKIDPVSGEMFFYSYFAPEFLYLIANKQGKITTKETISMPYKCLMHDFAITENFAIFPLFPLTWDFQRIMRCETAFQWEPNLNTRFGIMPKNGKNSDVIWFEDKACLGMHVVNAREQDHQIILEMVAMHDIPLEVVAFGDDSVVFKNYLTRWIFDLRTKKLAKEILYDDNMEFPRMDERFVGRQYRHTYLNATLHCDLAEFDSIVHVDFETQQKATHYFGEDSMPLEPIFIPRTKQAKEGDGYLISYVYRKKQNRSDLVILDAKQIDAEPLAVIQFPHRVPFGFHGCWVDKLRL
jgi:carotenoid cleavage dioxygenase-like enzyme